MADDAAPTAQSRQTQPLGDFPTPQFANAFADGVSSLTNSPTIVKYFLARFEPTFVGDGRAQLQPFAQIVMPMDGFAAMVIFFQNHLAAMVKQGYINEERLAAIRKVLTPPSPTT
jgi:hypothetical protein